MSSIASNIPQRNTLESLSCDVLQRIANHYLNPRERSRLSSCNTRLNKLLPPLLRIKVVSSGEGTVENDDSHKRPQVDGSCTFHSLVESFFVTPVDVDRSDDNDDADVATLDRCLTASENLVYKQQYFFWTFDYERGNKVFWGRHTRHSHKDPKTGSMQHRFSMGLRPRTPNQTWEVVGSGTGREEEYGDVVMWGDYVGLTVGGNNPHASLPDSTQRRFLSCLPSSESPNNDQDDDSHATNDANPSSNGIDGNHGASWCAVQQEWGPNEMLHLVPVHRFAPAKHGVVEKALPVHAIPEACDEGEYLLYSPTSLRDGLATCDGLHVKVNFDFWIEHGVMNFHAPVLPFTLGIPILASDYADDDHGVTKPSSSSSTTSPIANLLDIKSARWGCLIYYMAVAADVTEGKPLDMTRFLQRVTDHQDHSVKVNDNMDFVYIDVRGKKVRRDGTKNHPLPSTLTTPWCFVLSW